MTNMDEFNKELDLSIAAGNIVSNALQLTRNLFCPYCADAYMFEFTLKDHLKKTHKDIIERNMDANNINILSLSQQCLHDCPFCGASFTHFGLIPKHIGTYHGNELLKIWQENNFEKLQEAKENEPSILYAACSPGMTDIFDLMDTDCEQKDGTDQLVTSLTPKLKSILKKTPTKTNRIIYSPSTAAIRRSKSEAVKRSISVRRELRFDPNTKRSPITNLANSPKCTKSSRVFKFRNLFNSNRNTKLQKGNNSNKLITSTPINFLDDDDPMDSDANKKNWKATIRKNRPLFFGCERYQCAHCKKTWEHNADLLNHLRENHKGLKHWLRPQYECSLCGATFFSNNFLIRHCHMQHTPAKLAKHAIR